MAPASSPYGSPYGSPAQEVVKPPPGLMVQHTNSFGSPIASYSSPMTSWDMGSYMGSMGAMPPKASAKYGYNSPFGVAKARRNPKTAAHDMMFDYTAYGMMGSPSMSPSMSPFGMIPPMMPPTMLHEFADFSAEYELPARNNKTNLQANAKRFVPSSGTLAEAGLAQDKKENSRFSPAYVKKSKMTTQEPEDEEEDAWDSWGTVSQDLAYKTPSASDLWLSQKPQEETNGASPAVKPKMTVSAELPSVGSLMHGTGHCQPCAWFWKPQGCANSISCGRCHICSCDELKKRKQERKASFRTNKSGEGV